MFCSRRTNNRINDLQEKVPRLVHDDFELNGSLIIHHYNIQTLCTELYKVHYNLPQIIFSELLARENSTYNLRSKSNFLNPQSRTVFKESSSINYKIRYTDSLESFKKVKIRTWKPKDCPRRIWKNYMPNIGFLGTFLGKKKYYL